MLYTEGASHDAAHAAIAAAGGTIVEREHRRRRRHRRQTTNADFAAAARRAGRHRGHRPEPRHRRRARPRRRRRRGARSSIRPRPSCTGSGAASRRSGHGGGHGDRVPSRSPTCSGTCSRSAPPSTAPTGTSRASGRAASASSTPASTARTPTSPRTSTPQLSRNFTVDIPVDANGDEIDGPCEAEPDQSCDDPGDVDEDGHGTHVASTIASPINGIGIAGVAPKATIVNLRAGQDSGYFFLQPSVDALTYAGDIGIDVVNMSYYVDPWLFNCTDNPADSPDDQAEQRTIIKAMQRALDFAHRHGVTLVVGRRQRRHRLHQGHHRRVEPRLRRRAGRGALRARPSIPPSCISMPSEGNHVISVSSTGIVDAQGVLLRLRQRLRRRRRPRRRRLRHARRHPRRHQGRSSPPTRRRWPRPTARSTPTATPTVPNVVKNCDAAGTLRLLPVPAGHVDGVAARRRRGRADRQQVRRTATGATAARRCRPASSSAIMQRDGDQDRRARSRRRSPTPVTCRRRHGRLRRHVCEGTPSEQRLLRQRHRQRRQGRRPVVRDQAFKCHRTGPRGLVR